MKLRLKICLGIVVTSLLLAKAGYALGYSQLSPELIAEHHALILQIQETPKDPKVHFDLAMNYAYAGFIEEGWNELNKVNELDKGYADVVIKEYLQKCSEDPTNWKNFFKLGFGYYFGNKKEKALAAFDTAMKLDPNNVWPMGYKAVVMGDLGDIDNAVKLVKQALTINPKAAALHAALAAAYIKQGNVMGGTVEMLSYYSQKAKRQPFPPLKREKR